MEVLQNSAQALLEEARARRNEGRQAEAAAAYEAVVERYADTEDLEAQLCAADALLERAELLGAWERPPFLTGSSLSSTARRILGSGPEPRAR